MSPSRAEHNNQTGLEVATWPGESGEPFTHRVQQSNRIGGRNMARRVWQVLHAQSTTIKQDWRSQHGQESLASPSRAEYNNQTGLEVATWPGESGKSFTRRVQQSNRIGGRNMARRVWQVLHAQNNEAGLEAATWLGDVVHPARGNKGEGAYPTNNVNAFTMFEHLWLKISRCWGY